MTSTTKTAATDSTEQASLVFLDPRELLAHPDNPRKALREIKTLATSIREVGVIEPLVVTRDEEGWRIKAGWRRANAAIEAGLAAVPCVYDPAAASDKLSQLVAGVAENVNRDGLTAAGLSGIALDSSFC